MFKNLFKYTIFCRYVFNFFGFIQKHLWRIICTTTKIKTYWGSMVAISVFRSLSYRVLIVFCFLFCASSSFAMVNNDDFRISLINSLSKNSEIIRFYQDNEFQPLWVGNERKNRERRIEIATILPQIGFYFSRFTNNTP